ncbi:MAG: phosphoribosylformylglycinamidine synthase subunit PurL [Planctomycetia bacterium]|nr:phosphoribosylformylglycinamidine synthase subunit PurL [Planctomycetia bacterium]
MLWEVEIHLKGQDAERKRISAEFDLLTHTKKGNSLIHKATRGYLLDGPTLQRGHIDRLIQELLVDPLVETSLVSQLPEPRGGSHHGTATLRARFEMATVLLKPGVMDPVAQSVLDAARNLQVPLQEAHTFRRYFIPPFALEQTTYFPGEKEDSLKEQLYRVLANEAIERIVEGAITPKDLSSAKPYQFERVTVPIRDLDDAELEKLSQGGQLSLSLAEMRTIQAHYKTLGREPTDIELETIAQTWSEHCSHKTLKGQIDFQGRRIDNLLKETIFGATQEIRKRLGADDWCVSVFEDNAGVVKFTDRYHACFKVETHNHPSAIEPYGGANTGLGGVIRDPLGTGLGATPICNTDVFCFAAPDTLPQQLPPGVLHPAKIMRGVVSGVRDYGNRIGIPTINGAVCFDERYLANPLVYCGTIGLIPVDRMRKEPKAGDHIVALGGRTGRDGIHGATFSSVQLTAESEKVSGGAVQIGNAITQKKLLDVLLQARERGLYHAVTDCGAGGFSSAVGEMGAELGATVALDRAPLKYEGLSYTEIWISEAQERMILAVPPAHWDEFQKLCAGEDVEATIIGTFEQTGKLKLSYQGESVGELDMHFLHDGRPAVLRQATWTAPAQTAATTPPKKEAKTNFTYDLLKILASYNVCSKEWIIRQYDHEVQGGSVIKPLVGVHEDGPGDASVVLPLPCASDGYVGLAVGCGINPHYGDLDPYWMAAAAIDEALRNVVAVGADPRRTALLDNFCWGNTNRPEVLGSLVRAAEACRDTALAFNTPFISGKDSLNNEYRSGDRHIAIPPTLLISALGRVPDVRRCVTMDLKAAGNQLFLVGATRNELGGSHYHLVNGLKGGEVPHVNLEQAPGVFAKLHAAIQQGLIRACHDLSEGGLAVAVAEMAFAGGLGADITDLPKLGPETEEVLLFSESPTRFLVEVTPANAVAFQSSLKDVPLAAIGVTTAEPQVRIAGAGGEWIISAALADLKEAWQKPLKW